MIALLTLLALAGDVDQDAALLGAVRANRVAGIRAALEAGADPNVTQSTTVTRFLRRSTTRVTPVIQIAMDRAIRGDSRAMGLLLEAGADPNTTVHGGVPMLQHVAEHASRARVASLVDTLLKHGADPSGHRDGVPLTQTTPPQNFRAILPRLVEARADTGVFLCGAEDAEIRAMVLALDPDPDAWCGAWRPLMAAAASEDLVWLTDLLDAGSDPHAVGLIDSRRTPRPGPASALHIAAKQGWVEGVELLIERGADPNRPAGHLGSPPLSVATGEALASLVRAGAHRLDPDLPAEIWAVREITPAETGAYAARWLEEETATLPDTWTPHFSEVRRRSAPGYVRDALPVTASGLSAAELGPALVLTQSGCGRTRAVGLPPKPRDLRRRFGRPDLRVREGALRTFTWEGQGVQARVANGRAFELVGGCGPEGQGVIGQPIQALRAAFGPPEVSGIDWDRWAGAVAYYDRDGRVSRVGKVW